VFAFRIGPARRSTGWQARRLDHLTTQFYWNHFSNGYLVNPNEGHDSMGIRFGARF
jgi:hypothetical protein